MSSWATDPEIDSNTKTVIGIAFGNTTDSIPYTTPDGKAEVIANEEDRQIPSVLSWVCSEEYHGMKLHLVRNAKNTLVYFLDFLWKEYAKINPTNSDNSAHPMDTDAVSTVSINEITTRHLFRPRDSMSDLFGRKVSGTVITFLTDLSDTTKEALIATAVAGELVTPEEQGIDKYILVADLGGARCDAAVVASRDGMCTILTTAHNYELNRLKLDEVLADHFLKEFIKKYKVDLGNERPLAKPRLEAEEVKRILPLGTSATLSIESLLDRHDLHFTVKRLQYELSAKLFNQIPELDPLDVGEIILSGPTSHAPKISPCIRFPDPVPINAPATLTTVLNPAAIQASLIAEPGKEDIEQPTHPVVSLAPCLLHPIGVIIGEDSSFQTILKAQTAAPTCRIPQFDVRSNGDVISIRETVVEKVDQQVNSENSEDDSEEAGEDNKEEEEDCNRLLKVWKVIAEAATKGTRKSGEVEVTINVGSDLDLDVAVRAVGMQIGVRREAKPEARSAQ
ncbi:hypothetical protein HOY82DRAFT_622785 [Tuber indicum]|nr:hypothetical protein HOY82DRAFT_622785 [Tuber indicum]